jgi:diketogulonate reductase-like aldo/keto reductase
MPYDSRLSISDQVAASVASSINNLRSADDELSESFIDCLVLHSPFPNIEQTQEAWRAMERCVPNQVRTLGISNIYSLSALEAFYAFTKVQPSVVQNRFYPGTQYDSGIRKFCREKGIVYQSFWTLTANPGLLKSGPVKEVQHKVGVSGPVALYALVLGLGENMSVLDGTTNAGRMDDDLRGVEVVMEWVGKDKEAWKRVVSEFKQLVERQSS